MKRLLVLCSLCAAVAIHCVSCQSEPSKSSGEPAAPTSLLDKCKIDLSNPPDCTLSKFLDERIVWINNDPKQTIYVCFDPTADPFEAYAWSVPPNGGKRGSGSIDTGVHPASGGSSFNYVVSTSPCSVTPTPTTHPETNPKIIIK
jgi:hypothetical protein